MWELIKDLFQFTLHSKKYWMLPIALVLVVLGTLIVLGEGSTLLPFVYTFF